MIIRVWRVGIILLDGWQKEMESLLKIVLSKVEQREKKFLILQAPSGRPHRKLKLESTDVILSSSHAKQLASFLPEFRLWTE